MPEFLQTETLIIELLLVASLVAIIVKRRHIPYTVALVVVGLFITSQSSVTTELTPELILALFVPPLMFEAAFHLNLSELRRNAGAIVILAVPGVLLTMLIVGSILSITISIPLSLAMVFGAIISATDPIAVIALFRLLGVPKRLSVLMEGESLLNDGTALVLYNITLAIALTGKFNLVDGIAEFFRVSAGGIVLGSVLGWVTSRLIARIDDYLIEITLTTVVAYGAYLLGEWLGFSGVLAVVAAGLITGSLGPQGMSPTTRIVLNNFWEYVTFLVNSLVFLLIGLEVDIPALAGAWQPILLAIGAVLIARLVVIYGLNWITNRVGEPISLRWQHVMAWGGLRGALSLALALSLPLSIGANRELFRAMAFGIALFTLLIQATTMSPLIRRLGIITTNPTQVDYTQRHARLNALRSAESYMERQYREGLLSSLAWERIRPVLHQQTILLADNLRSLLHDEPGLESEELESARREVLRAQRSAYLGMRADGVISNEIYEQLAAEVDAALEDSSGTFLFLPAETISHQLGDGLSGSAQVEELLIEQGSMCDGKLVKEIRWPEHFVIASLRREDGALLIPKGDTPLTSGDRLTVVGEAVSIHAARGFCQTIDHGS